ncbi:MAG: hypothetical protein M0Z40_17335 [Actinomycetota bacterium]|nr:hypothetical protein [Actinomycetota bacterium]
MTALVLLVLLAVLAVLTTAPAGVDIAGVSTVDDHDGAAEGPSAPTCGGPPTQGVRLARPTAPASVPSDPPAAPSSSRSPNVPSAGPHPTEA